MSRGRHTNHTYVAVTGDGDDCHPETGAGPTASTATGVKATGAAAARTAAGREAVEQILTTSHAERSATETWHDYHPDQPPPLLPLKAMSGPGVGDSPATLWAMPPAPPERSGLSR